MGIPQIDWTQRDQTNKIILHSANTIPDESIGGDEMRAIHMRKGLLDIGYHFVIRRDGIIDSGRPQFAVGNHTEEHDEDSIGICLIGGINEDYQHEDNFTQLQSRICKRLVRILIQMYPEAEIYSHNELEGGDNAFVNLISEELRNIPLGEFD